ncbi:MAG: hypothetical protein WBH31_13515 [Promethearchaeia archaeon]
MKIKIYSKKKKKQETIQFLDDIENQLKIERDIRERAFKAIREENAEAIRVLEDIVNMEESVYEKRYKMHYKEINLLFDIETKCKELFPSVFRKRNIPPKKLQGLETLREELKVTIKELANRTHSFREEENYPQKSISHHIYALKELKDELKGISIGPKTEFLRGNIVGKMKVYISSLKKEGNKGSIIIETQKYVRFIIFLGKIKMIDLKAYKFVKDIYRKIKNKWEKFEPSLTYDEDYEDLLNYAEELKEDLGKVKNWVKRDDDENEYFPYPYIFKPPGPPGDLGAETQSQIKIPIEKKPESKIYCQYCGKELIKDEQFSHNCRKKPK